MTTTHDTPAASSDDTLVPGRVYFIGWRDASEHPNPVPPTPANDDRTWFYLVAVLGDVLYGVAFANVTSDTAHPIGATVSADVIRARLANGYAHHVPTVVSWWPEVLEAYFRSVAGETPTTSATTSDDYARGVTDGRAEASREFDAWKARAEEVAHEYADANDLCSEFDRCMEDVGLSPRRRTFDVTYRVTLPRNVDPSELDAEDLYSEAEDGAGSPWYVTAV